MLESIFLVTPQTLEPLFLIVAGMMAYLAVVGLLSLVLFVVGWRIFSRAGRPGWAVLIPLYNLYVYTQIVKRPRWWIFLYLTILIPFVGPLMALLLSLLDSIRLSKAFGKSKGFGIGLALLGIIFLPILAFGNAKYDGTLLNEKDLR